MDQTIITNVLIASFVVMAASLSGMIFITKRAKHWLFRNMKYVVTFAAGIFLMTAFGLAQESFEILPGYQGIFLAIGGFVGMWVLHTILPETHHHHDTGCDHCEPARKGIKLVIGDSIHNVADGVVLVSAFSVSVNLGIIATISIFIHEFVQEISEFFVLKSSGYTTKKTLILNGISATTILVGVCLGFLASQQEFTEGILLAISSGIFFHIVLHDLIPYKKITQSKHTKQTWIHILCFSLGIVIIWFLGILTPHTHENLTSDSIHIENQ